MAKGSGGTKAKSPSLKVKVEQAVALIDSKIKGDFTPKAVFGRELTSSDKAGVAKYRAFITGGKDMYDVNMQKVTEYLKNHGSISSVSVNDIYPIQSYLNKSRVAEYIANPNVNLSDRGLGITGYRLPNGKVMIDDGHHRVAAQIIQGKSKVDVKVININEYYAEKWFKSLSKKK